MYHASVGLIYTDLGPEYVEASTASSQCRPQGYTRTYTLYCKPLILFSHDQHTDLGSSRGSAYTPVTLSTSTSVGARDSREAFEPDQIQTSTRLFDRFLTPSSTVMTQDGPLTGS